MNLTRRNFVKIGSVAIASLSISNLVFGKSPSENLNLYEQNADFYKTFIGSTFSIFNENISVNATLIDVKEFSQSGKNQTCFSLIFQTPNNCKQDTYHVSHTDLGNFELFMTEGNLKRKSLLIATINRI